MAERPVRVGQELEVEITGFSHEGQGVGRYQNFTLFIPEALAGEKVRVRVTEVRKNFARGVVTAIMTPATDRAVPFCPVYDDCGGCQMQHLSYPGQLRMKHSQVVNAIERIGGMDNVTVHPVIGMTEPRGYRNKLQYPFGMSGESIVVGCYRRGTHQIIEADGCMIQHPVHHPILATVKRLAASRRIPVYNEATGQGLLRHVLIKNGFHTGQVMVVLVTNGDWFPAGETLAMELASAHPEIRSVVQNINRSRGNVVLGRENRVLWGSDGIIEELGGLKFKISANSFFQVNPVQTELLYNRAVEYAGLTGGERVVDAYCGVGSLTLFLARKAKEVYGIEVVLEAIADARRNAAMNGIENTRFLVGETETVLPKLVRDGLRFDVAVVDPPRSGCEASVLQALAEVGVARIVYVSCNPSTLARDLKILAELGYEAQEIQPVDMFPQTYHIECVVRVERKHTQDIVDRK